MLSYQSSDLKHFRHSGDEAEGETVMIYGDDLQIGATVKQSNCGALPCNVTTISDTIIKFECSAQMNPELPILLKLPGINLLTAQLLWKKHDEYGCQINYTFHPAVIKDMVRRLDKRKLQLVG